MITKKAMNQRQIKKWETDTHESQHACFDEDMTSGRSRLAHRFGNMQGLVDARGGLNLMMTHSNPNNLWRADGYLKMISYLCKLQLHKLTIKISVAAIHGSNLYRNYPHGPKSMNKSPAIFWKLKQIDTKVKKESNFT